MEFRVSSERDPLMRSTIYSVVPAFKIAVWRGDVPVPAEPKIMSRFAVSDEMRLSGAEDHSLDKAKASIIRFINEKYSVGILRHWGWVELPGWLIIRPVDDANPRSRHLEQKAA